MSKTEETTDSKPLKRIPALVDEQGLCNVKRAVMLCLATTACTDVDSHELAGQALVHICKTWMNAEVERLNG